MIKCHLCDNVKEYRNAHQCFVCGIVNRRGPVKSNLKIKKHKTILN